MAPLQLDCSDPAMQKADSAHARLTRRLTRCAARAGGQHVDSGSSSRSAWWRVYAAGGAGRLYLGQRRLMYFPDTARTRRPRSGCPTSRSAFSRRRTEHASSPGTARRSPGQPTLLYFHGNGGSLADARRAHPPLHGPGLGRLHDDLPRLRRQHGQPDRDRQRRRCAPRLRGAGAGGRAARSRSSLYGESLGTGIAARIAAELPSAGLILDAPYTSIVDVGGPSLSVPARAVTPDRPLRDATYIGPSEGAAADPARRARWRRTGGDGPRAGAAGQRAQAAGRLSRRATTATSTSTATSAIDACGHGSEELGSG